MDIRRRILILAAASVPCLAGAADGFYLGATGGQLQVDENAPTLEVFGLMPPPILYPVCGGTASIQYPGPLTGPQTLSGDANAGAWALGWRRGRFALELAPGPDVALSETRYVPPISVTQASCTTAPTVTVSAIQSRQREYTLDSLTLAALYDLDLGRGLRFQLRVQAASWDSTSYQAFDSSVFENASGIITTTTLASGSSRSEADGIDLGYGIGLAYPLGERFDLRLAYQRQAYDEAVSSGLTLSATFTF